MDHVARSDTGLAGRDPASRARGRARARGCALRWGASRAEAAGALLGADRGANSRRRTQLHAVAVGRRARPRRRLRGGPRHRPTRPAMSRDSAAISGRRGKPASRVKNLAPRSRTRSCRRPAACRHPCRPCTRRFRRSSSRTARRARRQAELPGTELPGIGAPTHRHTPTQGQRVRSPRRTPAGSEVQRASLIHSTSATSRRVGPT